MRPDLPWNVAGIPPEAREAARAAARREGLSVGEWLTRRILRSFADAGDEDELTRDSMSANKMYRAQEQAPMRRETDEMLDRVSRSEAETSDVYRRIEDQLRGVARRLDTTERSQSENNRVMNKAATEINIAAREQAQAFDQLAGHVVSLADRIGRVEQAGNTATLKDAVKGLHTGLSRVADQIAQNANHSATQISSLATNLEALATRLNEIREAADDNTRTFENRLVALDDRVYSAERAAQSSTDTLERVIETLQAHKDIEADAAHREAVTAGAIARLEDNIEKLEERGTDPEIDRRLGGIERSLADIVGRLETTETVSPKTVEDSLRKLVARVEATENRQRDTVSEFRSALTDTTVRLATLEAKPAVTAPPPPPPSFTPAPAQFDAPPFPDTPTPAAPPPFQAYSDMPPTPQDFEPAPAFADEPPFPPAPDFGGQAFGGDAFAPPPPVADSYLSAARRSARAAASQTEAEHSARGFSWGVPKSEAGAESQNRSRTMLIGFIVLIAVALIAGIILSKSLLGPSGAPNSNVGALFPGKTQTPVPQAGTPLHALSSPNDDTAQPSTAPPASAPVAPLQQKSVVPAPIRPVPGAAAPQGTPPQQGASIPAMDRLTALANAGNAKAETIVGLKYLNGDGVAVNEAQAAKWLERAAESGEPVAQYRLGTLYERGKGVAADPAKATHWYQAAAMQGNRKAMHNLAVALAEGTGVKKDMNEAARWFSKAASLGLADSEFNLAVLYERGLGVPQSLLDAYKWYAIAAAQGDSESKARIEALATQLSADDRAAAQHAADTFKPAAAEPRANVPPQLNDLPQG